MKKQWKILAAAGIFICGGWAHGEAAVQNGDSGVLVRSVQQALNRSGYSVAVDGSYGTKTADAVRAFQKRHSLTADGVVGPATYRALTGQTLPNVIPARKKEKNRIKGMTDAVMKTQTESASYPQNGIWQNSIGGLAEEVTKEARKYIGIPYRFGGTDTAGFDCSGFIQYIFEKEGVILPRMADEQYLVGERVAFDALEPGDLVFFSTYESGVSHSGIYMGGGNFISATSSRGIAVADMMSGYWRNCYVGAKRIL